MREGDKRIGSRSRAADALKDVNWIFALKLRRGEDGARDLIRGRPNDDNIEGAHDGVLQFTGQHFPASTSNSARPSAARILSGPQSLPPASTTTTFELSR